MSALSIQVPFPVFQDRDGQPLDNGYVWLGTSSLNPQTNPVVAYYDSALTIVATQPLRTLNGFISRAGSPAQVYVDAVNFSILVQDRQGTTVFSVPEGTGISPNASGVVYDPAGTGAVATTVQDKLRESVSVKDFGAVGDGVTDDRAAIQLAVTACVTSRQTILIPPGTYNVGGPIDVRGVQIKLDGAGIRPSAAFAARTMTDGYSSSSIFYIGGNANGSAIRGSTNMGGTAGYDINAADSGGVARATSCIEVYAISAEIVHNIIISDLSIKNATTANVRVHGYAYLIDFQRVYSSASPIGYSCSTVDPTSGLGPISFSQCYAVVCKWGMYLMGGSYVAYNIATDNCDVGIYGINAAAISIDGWGCEQTIEPLYGFTSSKITANNFYIATAGASAGGAWDTANSYSGQTGSSPAASGLSLFSMQSTDLRLSAGLFNVPAANFNKVFSNAASTGTYTGDSARVVLSNCQKSGVFPKESILGVNSYGAWTNGSAIVIDLDAYEEYTAANTACTGAITTACIWKAVRVGRVVTLTIPAVSGTASAVTSIQMGVNLPSTMRPTGTTGGASVSLINNNVNIAQGVVRIGTDGTIKIYRDSTFAVAFTAGNTAGLQDAATMSWVV